MHTMQRWAYQLIGVCIGSAGVVPMQSSPMIWTSGPPTSLAASAVTLLCCAWAGRRLVDETRNRRGKQAHMRGAQEDRVLSKC